MMKLSLIEDSMKRQAIPSMTRLYKLDLEQMSIERRAKQSNVAIDLHACKQVDKMKNTNTPLSSNFAPASAFVN